MRRMTSKMSSTGNEIDSALAMFALTALLMATSVAVVPPTWALYLKGGVVQRAMRLLEMFMVAKENVSYAFFVTSLTFAVMQLMNQISYNKDTDHLVFAGDMIFKGPDSAGVIDYARWYFSAARSAMGPR